MTDSEPVEAALRRLKKQLDREGVLWELRRRSFFVNGTERRRAKAFRKRFKTRMAALIAQRNAGMSQSAIAQANAAFWQRTGKP
ncbi:30S ribosomal protein S21 [Tuwongella immobilis]|nr:30S ribosomal protein S21 [Tuwongella immobilis]